LTLIGHTWNQVRNAMNITHEQFNALQTAAVYKAHEESWQDPHVGSLGPVACWPAIPDRVR
jgi:hypothetical protein